MDPEDLFGQDFDPHGAFSWEPEFFCDGPSPPNWVDFGSILQKYATFRIFWISTPCGAIPILIPTFLTRQGIIEVRLNGVHKGHTGFGRFFEF